MTDSSTASSSATSDFAHAGPGDQHRWLFRLIGEWDYEVPNPDGTMVSGTEAFAPIGEIWVQGFGRGPMPDGQPALTVTTIGYDPAKQAFVGTWLGSMMHHLWVYEGHLDESGDRLILEADGPDFQAPGTTRRYRDIIEFESEDVRTLTGEVRSEDGEWQRLMRARYLRRP